MCTDRPELLDIGRALHFMRIILVGKHLDLCIYTFYAYLKERLYVGQLTLHSLPRNYSQTIFIFQFPADKN